MTVTVSAKNYTQISACDSVSNWDFNKVETDAVTKKEGDYSLCGILNASGNNDATCTPGGYIDLSGVKHLRLWFLTSAGALLNTDALGGLQLFIIDGTNTAYYYVSGKDTYPGGWMNLVVDVSRDPDAGTKPANMAQCTSAGMRMNLTAAAKNVINTWIDHLCVCDGLIAYGDVSGSPFDPAHIFAADDAFTGGWGVFRRISGVYYLTGSLTLGDDGGSNICTFQALNTWMVFEDRKVNSGLYEIICVAGTGATSIKLGDKSGTAGISGCVIKSNSTDTPFKFTATDVDIDALGLYGTTFDTHGLIDLLPDGAFLEELNCNYVNGQGQIQPNTMVTESCNFVNFPATVDGAVILESTSHKVKNSNFINNYYAIEIAIAGDYTLDGLEFLGNTTDINNTSGGTVNISSVNADNPPTTYTGDTNITASASHKLTGVKENSEVTYVETGTENVLFHVENVDGTGITEYAYNAAIEKTVDIHIHHINYVPIIISSVTLTATGGSIPITQNVDRVYFNP